MHSIGHVAQITNLTARTLRHYEDKGLITSFRNVESGHRHYSSEEIQKIERVKKFKSMEFSLDEIKSLLFSEENMLQVNLEEKFEYKIEAIDRKLTRLELSKEQVQNQLLVTRKFFNGSSLEINQRRVLMETLKTEILNQLKKRKTVGMKELELLKRENYLIDNLEKRKFFKALKDCLAFAKREGIRVGPARGASPALLSLYALGWSDFDPTDYNLIPERFAATDFDLHIDVEFKNGKKFIDFCKQVSQTLPFGRIEAFKLPILDIIENVKNRIESSFNCDDFDNDDPLILDQFRKGEIDYIFSFDIPKETLMSKYMDNNYYKLGKTKKMFSEYLKSQEIYNYKDLLNIEAIFRPNNLDTKSFMREYIDRYPKAKVKKHSYTCLSSAINEYLKPNFGVIIYQEDIIHIIREYTSWSYEKCNYFRRSLQRETISEGEKIELLEYMDSKVVELLEKESPVVFCKAHAVGAWSKIIKTTALFKALYKDIYLEEIKKWESENGYSWGDFGFIFNEISILQQ